MAVDWRSLASGVLGTAIRAATRGSRQATAPRRRPARPATSRAASPVDGTGDFTGVAHLEYAPNPQGRPDPGEIVWTRVTFEDDRTRGKDRPVLIVAREGEWLLALMLSSKDHQGPGSDEQDESRHGREWVDIGSGAWDRAGRPSQVRIDRVLRVDPDAVRREGAELDVRRFGQVAAAVRRRHGWT